MQVHNPLCPECEQPFTYVNVAEVQVRAKVTGPHIGIVYVCPNCNKAIPLVIDQMAVMAEGVRRTGNLLKKPE